MRLIIALLFCIITTQGKAQMNDSTIIVGKVTHALVSKYIWYDKQYQSYHPKDSIVQLLKIFAPQLRLKVVLGTWCSDSKEHVPALFKIAQTTNIAIEAIELIAVDKKKKCPTPDISQLHIEYVPTIFVYKNGIQMGSIIEAPTLTLEEDLLTIITKKNDR